MHDVQGLTPQRARGVRGVQAFEQVDANADRDACGHGLSRFDRGRNESRKRLAVHVLHDEVQAGRLFDQVEHGRDVGVVNARYDVRFVAQHLHEALVARELLLDDLDGHHSPKPVRARHLAEAHFAHAARGNDVAHHVTPADDLRLVCVRVGAHFVDSASALRATATAGFDEMGGALLGRVERNVSAATGSTMMNLVPAPGCVCTSIDPAAF